MKIFLDSIDTPSIEEALKTGLIDGITMNPLIMAEAPNNLKVTIETICTLMGEKPVNVEVTETDAQKLYTQAHAIAELGKNIVVKIPCHADYYTIVKKLINEGIAVNGTVLFNVFQGICMAKLGSQYISPFVGRCDENGGDGIQLIYDLYTLFKQHGITKTKILAASLRSPERATEALLAGADIITVSPKLFKTMLQEKQTDDAIERFDNALQKAGVTNFP